MKLIAKEGKDLYLYDAGDMFVLKISMTTTKKMATSTHNWIKSNIGRYNEYFLIRENDEVLTNGYSEMLKSIPTDFRYYNLMLIWTDTL
jgi:hypothetical protein